MSNQIRLVILIFLLASFPLQARIISVTANTNNNQASLINSTQIQIDWRISVEARNSGLLTVRSMNGTFFAPNRETQLGMSSNLLTQNRTLNEGQGATLNIRESLVIPQTVARRAQQLGFSQVLFLRTFTDTPDATTATSVLLIDLAGASSAGQIQIDRVQMQFSNGKRVTSLSAESELQAEALLRYRGSGMIEYSWEIASPPSTQGQIFYTPMVSRKQFVLAGSEIKLQSPILPSSRNGLYFVRLKLNNPNPNFEMPILRYTVVPQTSEQPKSLLVGSPPQDAVLSTQTQFSWQAVSDAKVYQVEVFLEQPNDTAYSSKQLIRPVTGTQVPATKETLSFNAISLAHLRTGQTYYWRVIAVDQAGKVLAISKSRRLIY
ncbi:MAG: hypothetical protein ABJI60_19445 [Kangiellaceae bacterium]